ncbi:helix-turn-helix domain-containing protein [Nocardia aobensis]|uniref:helix-turn-helix domain-containing protein n=1 Tax=Nocardia aobensis TaxID=257277 RepID=UPI0012F621B9|nr:helix-turn-helix transcriptional regulator [Nocardia aobensis]
MKGVNGCSGHNLCPVARHDRRGGTTLTVPARFSNLGTFVEKRRKQLDLDRIELGRRVGLAAGTIKKIELEQRRLVDANLRKVLVALEVQENNVRLLLSAREGRLHSDDSAPCEQELRAIEAITVPVFILNTVMGRIVAANRACESLMHLRAGVSIYEWLVADPWTRQLLGQDWYTIVHGVIWGAAPLIECVMPDGERERLLEVCSRVPEWETMWTKRPATADFIYGARMTNPGTGNAHDYLFTATELRFPPRVGWWQGQLTPADRELAPMSA